MHCLWCTRRILLARCPPNILQCKYHSDLIDMRASRIYVEICYSIEIDISIGLYQTGLKGIPATMYSVAKTKYMLNTDWCLIGFLTKLIISSLIEDGLLVPVFSFKGNKCTNIRKTESFDRNSIQKRCYTDDQWLTLSILEVVTSMRREGGRKERNPLRTWKKNCLCLKHVLVNIQWKIFFSKTAYWKTCHHQWEARCGSLGWLVSAW